jgi:signal transduction histidine kinase
VRTFSHSLLAELSRIETALADQVKSTFISSISHELRTPLHGILAGSEFLQSTDLSTFQQEMTETIEVAGRTLLDTVDHILEYSKMSSTMRALKSSDESTLDRALATDATGGTATSGVDLAKLTEK